MTPSSKAEVICHFQSVWAKRPEHDVGLAIIEFLSTHVEATTLPLTVFFDVAKAINKIDNDRTAVLSIVNYLSGSDLNLLTAEVELIDNDEIVHLQPDQAFAATYHHIHPSTGIFDPDIKSKLFICFTPSELAKKVLGS